MRTQVLDTAKIVILAALVVVGVQYAFAGPPAGAVPPACPSGQPGCDAPVNVGSSEQAKGGGFSANSLGSFVLNVDDDGGTPYDISLLPGTGITVTDGGAITTNGIVEGATLEAGAGGVDSTGVVDGASFSVGSTEVISSSKVGTFAGGVMIETNNNSTRAYLKIDAENFGGTKPLASECASESDYGKMIFSFNQSYIYICGFDVVTSTSAWWYAPLELQLPS